ncbi:MAG: TonB-dependent receptor [Balneolaceae bacterium]|nr:MAG: TonB-dependent receptor [Balneolaceae bacterium]
MYQKLLTILLMVFFSSQIALAQTGSIVGQVTDAETGETLPGASILLTQLDRGAATDFDGNYVIQNVPAGTYNLTASFVGYRTFRQTVQVNAGQTTTLNIVMQTGAIGLDEVIVSGYAVTTKRELTGSIASVRAADIQDVPLQNTEALLQGRAAGVNVTADSGNPGAGFRVNIRGNGSVNAATQPLYIVDGVQISFDGLSTQAASTSPLNALNPNDIESIEVLKDASSAAIYGAQAAAGVVIITTKRGQVGRTQITARAETGVRSLARNVDYITSEQYVDYLAEGAQYITGWDFDFARDNRKDFLLGFFGEDPFNPGQLANTDWQDFIYSDGVTQRYNISMSGGTQATTFFLSGGYEDTEGTAFNTDFTRLNLRSNIDHQISDRWRTSLNVNLARSTQFGVCQDGNFINCPISQAMFEAPMSFPYNEDGSYNPFTRFGLANNPAVQMNEVDRVGTVTQIISNMNLIYRANDWLTFNGLVGVDYRNTDDQQYRSAIAAPAQGGFAFYAARQVQNFNTNLVANLRQTFNGVHNVSGLVGTEYRRNYVETRLVQGNGFPGPFFTVLNATADPVTAAGTFSEWRLGSYFTNVKYNYDERYFLNVVARYDGHSRFGAETRWGFFPSFSGAWRISEENFFDVSFIDELKLRVGYGTTGNSAIGNFASRGLYSAAGSYQGSTGLRPTQLANVNLGWEEATEINVGLDYELLQGRIFGAIDVYRKDNNELLFGRPLPSDSGFGSITENIGSVRNQGIEFEISTVNVNTGGFMWSSRFNIAFMENEILSLPEGTDIRADNTFDALKIGKPIGLIQTPRWAGVNPADGRPMWYDADGNITFNPVQSRDAIEYKDGVANVFGGFGNTLSYKGVTLDTFFQFSFGQWAFAQTDFYFTRTPDFLMNMTTEVMDRWRQPGDITYYPRAMLAGTDYVETANYRTQLSTQSMNNASYIRLKNISLSYNLPTRWTQQVGLNNVRVYASAINLLTWTAWPYYDPEVAFNPTDIYNNQTAASYPTERQVNAGIEIRF